MSEADKLQGTPRKGRKPKIEKMEVEKKTDVIELKTESESPKEEKKEMTWIRNPVACAKTCSVCNSTVRGWAYREPFKYCPKCGAEAKVAE